MSIIKGFSTKDPNWKDKVFQAINEDPNAKVILPFETESFKSEKNPFKKLNEGKIISFKGMILRIRSFSLLDKLFNK